jgi:hypothetical protein
MVFHIHTSRYPVCIAEHDVMMHAGWHCLILAAENSLIFLLCLPTAEQRGPAACAALCHQAQEAGAQGGAGREERLALPWFGLWPERWKGQQGVQACALQLLVGQPDKACALVFVAPTLVLALEYKQTVVSHLLSHCSPHPSPSAAHRPRVPGHVLLGQPGRVEGQAAGG